MDDLKKKQCLILLTVITCWQYVGVMLDDKHKGLIRKLIIVGM